MASMETTELNSTKKILDGEKKVKIKLAAIKDSKEENFVPVSINGYIFQVKKGETVEVPETVATILEQGGYI